MIMFLSIWFFICISFFFFFQAEDGIRDHCVTGVQTCALPISTPAPIRSFSSNPRRWAAHDDRSPAGQSPAPYRVDSRTPVANGGVARTHRRSGEGRGGEKGRFRGVPDH